MQTLRAGCSKAEPNISPRRWLHSSGAERPKFNQLEMVTTFTYEHTYIRVIMVTDPPTRPQTQTGPIKIHCAAASAQCN